MNTNCVKVINQGDVPEFLIYEHDSKILIYKIQMNNALSKSSPMYQMYNAITCKIIDGRTIPTKIINGENE